MSVQSFGSALARRVVIIDQRCHDALRQDVVLVRSDRRCGNFGAWFKAAVDQMAGLVRGQHAVIGAHQDVGKCATGALLHQEPIVGVP